MNHRFKSLLFVFFSFCIISSASGQAKISHDHISLNNDVLRKTFTISETKPGSIQVSSLYDKVHRRELMADQGQLPWFEFVIDHKVVTSNDPVWQFEGLQHRTMPNQGTEYTLNFKGVSAPVRGLLVSVKEQLFAGSALVREKLILHVNGSSQFALNKDKGKLHFIFPRYTYHVSQPALQSREIRIATWDGEVLDTITHSSYDDRLFDNSRYGGDHNLSQAHMFHPKVIERDLAAGDTLSFKGPMGLLSDHDYHFFTAYEHASQDNMTEKQPYHNLDFLHIDQHVATDRATTAVQIMLGGYLDGEKITAASPYESVWTANGFSSASDGGGPEKLLHNYLLKWITAFPKTRETKFYYNTWAMEVEQRNKGKKIDEVMTYDRLFQEIRYAHQMGVEVFVLDAGWEKKAGIWQANARFNQGLKPIYDTLRKYHMELGLWMSPLFIDPGTKRYQQHEDWIIKDDQGKPVKLGSACIFDFVSGFSDLFIADCKRLIDQGVRYFKWDAIGTYYSYCTHGLHGSSSDAKEDVIARYGYLLPLFFKKAMVELMQYNPDVVIEIDLTENKRALMGLSTLSAAKLFFVNNGASDYGDYSQYRAKSMRSVANEYNGIIPLQLFTYANYPHNAYPFMSERYNVNSSIICGKGFWGDLSLMSQEQRSRIGELVKQVRMVSPFLKNATTSILGRVGASPEIYTTLNAAASAGQVIAFSGSAMDYLHQVTINPENFLGVTGNAFSLQDDTLNLAFQFPAADESREAFILPNRQSDVHVISCSSWLKSINLTAGGLEVEAGDPGKIVVDWPARKGRPQIKGSHEIKTTVTEIDDNYLIEITTDQANTIITIR